MNTTLELPYTTSFDKKYSKQEIEEVHDILTFLTDILASQPEQDEWRLAVANKRKIDVRHFEENKCFFVPDLDYLKSVIGENNYTDLRLGFLNRRGYSALKARFIFPCYNSKNKVVGFVGYDNLSQSYKYLLTTTLGFDKSNVTYGYKDLEFIYKEDYVIFVEGVMDYFRLRSLGYPVFCMQGVHLYPKHKRVFDRISNKISFLDSDNAGFKSAPELKKMFKYITDIQINRQGLSKLDADAFLSYKENAEYFAKVINLIKLNWKRVNYNTVKLDNKSPELQLLINNFLESQNLKKE